MKFLFITTIFLILFTSCADAESVFIAKACSWTGSGVESLYNQGQYQKTLEYIENIFRSEKNLSDSILIHLYTYQAFSYVASDKKEQAINTFRYLLIINPYLSLDPKFVSPKIIEVFEESKRLVGDTGRLKPLIFIPTEELNPKKQKNQIIRNQIIKSLLYPGLGQLSGNKKVKGYLFLGGETASLIGLITTHFLTGSAHSKYLDNRNLNQMDRLYNNYALWYRARTGFIISSISIWILSYIDITIFD